MSGSYESEDVFDLRFSMTGAVIQKNGQYS